MIGIVNLNIGNLRSIANAIYEVGYDFLFIDDPSQIDRVSHLIIPGVGHYQTAMRNCINLGFAEPIKQFSSSGKPLLGICLGMQIFATYGYEGGEKTEGLNLIAGEVIKFADSLHLRLPHVGWNNVHYLSRHPVINDIKDNCDFYFVHSYHYRCANKDDECGLTHYGENFPSIITHNNIIGFQFHPEKSQKNCLQLLENFCKWDGLC